MAAMNVASVLVPEPNEVRVPVPPVRLPHMATPTSNSRNVQSIMIVLFIIGAAATFFLWILITGDPEELRFKLDSLSVSNLNITDNQISGDWVIGLSITNPNRLNTIELKRIRYSVAWSGAPDGAIVNGSEAKPVVQPAKSQTAVSLKGSAELLTLSDVLSGDYMRRDVASHGFLAFEISLSATFIYKGSVKDPGSYSEAWNDIRVPLLPSNSTPNTTLTGIYTAT